MRMVRTPGQATFPKGSLMADDKSNEGFMRQAGDIVASALRGVMRDGTIAAAGRMGIDELGAALKAFPDSIQQQETGSIWNPTQGEVALARADHPEPTVEPVKIDRLPSPAEIAIATRPYQPAADQGQHHDLDHGQTR